jgi:hypothetical protein
MTISWRSFACGTVLAPLNMVPVALMKIFRQMNLGNKFQALTRARSPADHSAAGLEGSGIIQSREYSLRRL